MLNKLMMKPGGRNNRIALPPVLLLSALLWLAVLAGCIGGAPTQPPSAVAPPPVMTVAPTGIPAPTPLATPVPEAARPAAAASPAHSVAATPQLTTEFITPPDRDFFRLVKELVPGTGDVDRVVRRDAPTLEPGHRQTFQLVDLLSNVLYESDFELRLVTPHAYWFVEDGIEVGEEALEQSAHEFEASIRPRVTGVFGEEWTPGVDGDPHLYIINANLQGAGGYFSAADEYPRAIRPVSNEIEAIYINTRYLPPGTERFSEVLAHELQHAVHWNADLSEETWVNEGLSELAVTLAGYPQRSVHAFRQAGPTSLTHWPANDIGGAENYGAASMFMHYLTEHYGNRADLRPLLEEAADGIPGINAYLEAAGHDATFVDVFRDWAIANLLDDDSGPYSYADLPASFPVSRGLRGGDELASTIPQYANEYIRLEQVSGPAVLTFEGDATTSLLPVDVGALCWWSNKGDVIDSTLTATVDLRQANAATLNYEVWFSIEEDWDFAYLEVSEDGGQTWTIIETPLSSTDDPLNVSFGPGYTGESGGWQEESVSLDKWAGQEILVRFQYITDAAIHDHGLCVRQILVPGPEGGRNLVSRITPRGFLWTNNVVDQDFMVQVVYDAGEAGRNRVLRLELDSENRGEITLEPDPDARRIVAVIQPMAPSTRMPASYTLRLEAVN